MIYELRQYRIKPGTMGKFMELLEALYPYQKAVGAAPLGCWSTEVGPLNQVTLLQSYDNYEQRDAATAAWARELDEKRRGILGEVRELLVEQQSAILKPAIFSELS